MQPLSSAITGALEAVTPRSSPGGSPGTIGSSTSLSVNVETVRGWLLAQPSVEAADEALRISLQSSLGVAVGLRTEGRFPENAPAYRVTVGAVLAVTNAENLPAAISRIESSLVAPTKTQAEDWLVMLQAACAGGRKSEMGQMVALELYAGTLTRFPADVAREACQALALKPRDGATWFPTLAELNSECERRTMPREAMLRALKTWRAPTEAEVLKAKAYDLRYAVAEANVENLRVRRSDPDRSSELEEFIASATAEASELEREARALGRAA